MGEGALKPAQDKLHWGLVKIVHLPSLKEVESVERDLPVRSNEGVDGNHARRRYLPKTASDLVAQGNNAVLVDKARIVYVRNEVPVDTMGFLQMRHEQIHGMCQRCVEERQHRRDVLCRHRSSIAEVEAGLCSCVIGPLHGVTVEAYHAGEFVNGASNWGSRCCCGCVAHNHNTIAAASWFEGALAELLPSLGDSLDPNHVKKAPHPSCYRRILEEQEQDLQQHITNKCLLYGRQHQDVEAPNEAQYQ